jgi:TonB-linked SusC/RagA family outer membrane protein
MSTRNILLALLPAAVCSTVAAMPASAQAQQSGVVSGRVTDVATGQPVVSAQVQVLGTGLGVETNNDGQFVIRGVRPGPVQLRILRVGFAEARQASAVQAGQTSTVNVTMRAVPLTLNPVVTTATGSERRVEVGNVIADVKAATIVSQSAIANVGDLLQSRAPGVQVYTGTQTGAGTRIRIRGTSSMSLTNNPIYYIDGIRVEGATGSSAVSVGGTTPSRVNDINPEEIESIEVVKGPSAATLYGTDAANGVIVITTKRGVAGRAQFTYYTEQGAHVDQNHYPTAYRGWRTGTTAATNSTASNTTQCFLTQVPTAACVQDSVTSYNLYDDPEATPNGLGYRQQHGLQVRGGSEVLRYFLHGEWENEDGVLKVPEFEQRYLTARGLSLRDEMQRPNHMDRITTRGNFNLSLTPSADLALNVGYTSQDVRLPMSDDSGTLGIAGNTYGGPGFKYNLTATGDTLYGWRQFTPRDVYQAVTNQAVKRLIMSTNGNFRPSDWLSLRSNFGLDYANRLDTQLCRFNNCPDVGGDSRLGYKFDYRSNFFTYTADASGTASRRINDALQSKTTVGVQFNRTIFDRNGATGVRLPAGSTTLTSAAVLSADEATSETRTLGAFVEQNVALNDRLFVTAAVRSDRNSAFGKNFKTVFYPKLSASYILSEEPFFPKASWLNQLRLRSAYGASGVQPGTTDAASYYLGTQVRLESGEAPAAVFNTFGNPELKPERSTELEMGIDGTFLNSRLTTELTYYRKSSKDALVSSVLPPSGGTGATSVFRNVGEVRNSGFEAMLTAQLVQRPSFGWDVTLSGSTNDNELVSLGGLPPIVISSTLRNIEGYPLNGWWSRPITGYADANGDGIIVASEVTIAPAGGEAFLGYSSPRRELSLTNGLELWQRRIHVGAQIDYKGGFKTYNNTERIRCASRNNCAGLIDPNASLFEQARTVAVRTDGTVAGFIEDGDYIRFRELNASFTAPEAWASRYLHGRSLGVTLAVRNLNVLWTKYTGVDPEAFATTGDAPSEFQAFAPPTYYSLRLSLGF